jgi:micrococcal nuclease
MYEYRAQLVRVIDGDTIVCNIDLGFGIWQHKEHVRLARINTPETRTLDLVEKAKGLEAKEFVSAMFNKLFMEGGTFTLQTYKDHGKFGRFIAEVNMHFPDRDFNLNDGLVMTGHGEFVDY